MGPIDDAGEKLNEAVGVAVKWGGCGKFMDDEDAVPVMPTVLEGKGRFDADAKPRDCCCEAEGVGCNELHSLLLVAVASARTICAKEHAVMFAQTRSEVRLGVTCSY